jgi:AraC-like DNA-binding protein/mannose-6-phosphate isomerase-like protein (cupin superfamily)
LQLDRGNATFVRVGGSALQSRSSAREFRLEDWPVPRMRATNWQEAYPLIQPQINAEGKHVFAFDASFPVDVRFLIFSPQAEITLNRHDYFELLFVHSGAVLYQVQDRYLSLQEGDLFVMGSTLLHRMSQYSKGRLRAAVLYFHPDLIRRTDSTTEGIEYLMPFLVQEAGFPHVIPAKTGLPSQVFDLMRRVAAELPAASNRGRLSVKTYVKMILVLLVNHYSDYRGNEGVFLRNQLNLERLKPVFECISRDYWRPLSVCDGAKILHLHKSSFMRFFKQVTGQSFITYLNHFRIAKAQALLLSTDKSVAEISQEVGFCDQSYFGLMFRKLVHQTPRDYRRHAEGITR